MPTYGGETPLLKWESYTFEAPAGTTSAAPVEQGELFKVNGTVADADGTRFKVIPCVAGDDPGDSIIVMALHRIVEIGPVGCQILAPFSGQVREIPYHTGEVPTVGGSIQIATGNVRKIGVTKAFTRSDGNVVLRVDTTRLVAEVLFA